MLSFRLLLGVALLSTTAIACTPPSADGSIRSASTGRVYSAASTSTSKSKLGITRWHSTSLSTSEGVARTIDGQDKSGKVKFLTTFRSDRKTSTLHVQAILPKRGEYIYDYKNQSVVKNTMPSNSLAMTKAFTTDWAEAHPSKSTTSSAHTSSTHNGFRAGTGRGRPGGGKPFENPGEDDPVASAGNYWLLYLGHKYGYISDSKFDAYNDPDNYKASNYDAKGKRITPSTDTQPDTTKPANETKPAEEPAAETKTPEETPAEEPAAETTTSEEAPAEQPTETTPDATTPEETPAETTAETPEDGQSTELPDNTEGGNLDEMGTQEAAPEETTNDEAAATTNEESTSSGEEESSSAEAFALRNTCKKVATSKTTSLRACVKY